MDAAEHLGKIRLVVRRGPIDNKPRELIIHPEFIRFETGKKHNPYIKIDKASVKEYRFGVRWISGYRFIVGREYQIFINDRNNHIMKLHFRSFYGIGKVDRHNLYSEILGNLWKYYFRDIANRYIQEFWNDLEFSIGDVTFYNDRLKIKKNGIFTNDLLEITWDKVRIKDYQTYFVIYSADDPAKENKSFSYMDEWNTYILHSVTMTIVNNIDKK